MAPKIEVVHNEKLLVGEGPHWDQESKVLYYVDIFQSTVLKYDPSTSKITRVIVDKAKKIPLSWVVPVAGSKDKFVISYGRKIAVLTWDGVSSDPSNLEIFAEVEGGADVRFNDGKADPSGRLWGGTMAEYVPGTPEKYDGSLYSLSKDGKSLTTHFGSVGISNGLAWSSDNKTFYYVDSFSRTVDAFDYDIDSGVIKNRRVAFDLKKNGIDGIPDGMTIDKNDKLWVAVFGSSSVYQIDPSNETVLQSIKFEAPGITSCTWGGPNLDELYVTSASLYDKEEFRHSGHVFRVTGLGASGFSNVAVKL